MGVEGACSEDHVHVHDHASHLGHVPVTWKYLPATYLPVLPNGVRLAIRRVFLYGTGTITLTLVEVIYHCPMFFGQ